MKAKVWKLSVLMLTLVLGLSAFHAASAVGVISTIAVGSNPQDCAYDSGRGEIFVANYGNNSVSVISDTTNAVVANITVGTEPRGVAYDPVKGEIFVANYGNNSVSVILDSFNTVVATVNVGSYPDGVAYDSAKGELFVANYESSSVSVISDSNNTVTATVAVPANPDDLAYSGNGEVIVTNSAPGSASVISDSTNAVVANVTVGMGPFGVAYDSGKGEIFVANFGSNSVSVISDITKAVIATVTLPTGGDPQRLAYDSGKGEIFVANQGDNTVSVISDSNNTLVATVNVRTGPFGVAYDSGKGEIFVTNAGSNSVSVISDSPNLVATSVTASPGTVDQGQTSTLSSSPVTTGASPYTYQWFSEAPNSSYSSISGATSFSYGFSTTNLTIMGAWNFELQVKDATGATATSSPVTVTVNSALAVAPTLSASTGTVDQGQASILSSTAVTAGTSPYTYQWFDKAPGGSYTKVGANSSSFSFSTSAATATGSWNFILQVTDSTGATVNSTAALILVNSALAAPSVSSSSSSVNQGQTSSLTSSAVSTGTSPYAYLWFSEAPGASSYSPISSATSSGYSFATSTSTATASWSFIIQVTDNVGSAVNSTATTVTVNAPAPPPANPTVSITPSSWTMDVGQSKSFTANPSGGSGNYASFQWYVSGALQSGVTASSFNYAPSSAGSASITVKVTDSLGSTAQSSTSVTVNSALIAPTVSSSINSINKSQTSNLTSSPMSSGTSPYTYQWFNEPPGSSSFSSVAGATSPIYNFVTSNSTAAGIWQFKIQVTDQTGTVENSPAASVTVNTSTPSPSNPSSSSSSSTSSNGGISLWIILAVTGAASGSTLGSLWLLVFRKRSKSQLVSSSAGVEPATTLVKPVSGLRPFVFISYVEEDADVVLGIAKGLEKAGYLAWYYQRDSIPGVSYLIQTAQAIEQSQAVILVISPHSIVSNQVTKEVIHAHEACKPFVPLLKDVSHLEFQKQQPEWREAIGSATSTIIPDKGVQSILPRIITGLERMGVKKAESTKDQKPESEEK